MDDKMLLAPRPPLSISTPWILVAVVVGGLGTIVLIDGASDHGALGSGLAVFVVTIVVGVGGLRQAFLPLRPAVSIAGADVVPVIAEIVRLNPPTGMAMGTYTVRFDAPDGAPREAEMLAVLGASVGQQVRGRYSLANPAWVVADGQNIVSTFDLIFKGTVAFGVVLLAFSPFV